MRMLAMLLNLAVSENDEELVALTFFWIGMAALQARLTVDAKDRQAFVVIAVAGIRT